MTGVVRSLARVADNIFRRYRLMLPFQRQAASFLLPAAVFRTNAWHDASDRPSSEAIAGKRVLCLVETNADTTIVRRHFAAAAHVDFVLQSEHASITTFIAKRSARAEHFTARLFDNILPTGGAIEQACSQRNFDYFTHLSRFFESAFESSPEIAAYSQVSPLLAGFIEPLVYHWCFVAPKTLEAAVQDTRPEVIIVLYRNGSFFGRLLPCLAQAAGSIPLLIGYTHALAHKRREVMKAIAEHLNDQPLRPRAGVVESGHDKMAQGADPGLRLMMRQFQATTDLVVWRQAPDPTLHDRWGAVTTTDVGYVSYNYRFRQRLLERLAQRFDLGLFGLDVAAEDQKPLRAELQQASSNSGRDICLTSYSPTATSVIGTFSEYLDRHRGLWQDRLVELAGGEWVLPIFNGLIFEAMVAKIFAGLEYAAYLVAILRRHPPAFALAITGETSRTALLLAAARQAGVPTFDMQVVAMNDDPRNRISLLPKADHYFAMDVQSAELLAGWGWEPDRLYLTGTVRFDQLQVLNSEAERRRARSALVEDRYRHFIVFISQALSFEYCRAVLEVIAGWIGRRTDTKLLVKLHPREPDGNKGEYESILAAAAPTRNWQVTSETSVDDAMLASDLVIGVYSLALLEAACLRLPVIAANLSGKRLPEPTNFGDRGCILGASTADELRRLMTSIIDDAGFRSEFLAKQTDYFREHSYMVDGGAMERIATTIEEIAQTRPVSAKSLSEWRARHSVIDAARAHRLP